MHYLVRIFWCMKDALLVLVGSEPVFGSWWYTRYIIPPVFCLFLFCLSHLLRGGKTELRIHLASGSGYFRLPFFGLPLPHILFSGYFFFFFLLFLFFLFFFLRLSFFFPLISQCICVAGMLVLCLSYPVRWHGIAFLSTSFTPLRCSISVAVLWPQSLYLSRMNNQHG